VDDGSGGGLVGEQCSGRAACPAVGLRCCGVGDCGGLRGLVDLPRFDSPPLLGRLLDDAAGHFRIAPLGADAAESGWSARWRYRLPGLVLETTWSGPTGELVVVDAMALGPRERGHQLGHSAPGVLLRRVRCTRGSVPVRVEFVPRPSSGWCILAWSPVRVR